MVGNAFNPSTGEAEVGRYLGFQGLVYIVSSRIARSMYRKHVSKKKNTQTNKNADLEQRRPGHTYNPNSWAVEAGG